MATVTGKTSDQIDFLLGPTIVGAGLDAQGALTFQRRNGGIIQAGSLGQALVGATINSAKHLIFTKMQGGAPIDAGPIVPNLLDAWPVTSVFIGITPTNPSALLGGGTWQRIAQGRMLVGVDSTDPNFDAAEETGGSKTATLVAANLPKHIHTMAHNHNITHAHASASVAGPAPAAGGTSTAFTRGRADTQVNGGGMVGEFGGSSGASSAANTGDGGAALVAEAFDVLNPYVAVYIWKRTA